MKQKIFEVGKKAYTFNQARYEEDMGRCVITAVSERYITDDIGNKFTVSSDDRDYLTAEGNRTLRLYVSEKEALEDLEHIRITNWINQHMKKLPSGSLKQLLGSRQVITDESGYYSAPANAKINYLEKRIEELQEKTEVLKQIIDSK